MFIVRELKKKRTILLDRIVSYWSQIPAGMLTMWVSGYTGMKLWPQFQETTPEALPRS
jgi:hypothetical protein